MVHISQVCKLENVSRSCIHQHISHLDSSKKMYDALTNIFSIINIGKVMSLKNELHDTKMTKDDTIASYFVRISQLRDQLKAIEETIP
jgi:hypothetical protein